MRRLRRAPLPNCLGACPLLFAAQRVPSLRLGIAVTGSYPPLNTMKSVGNDLWIVDGSLIRFGPKWLSMPFPTRMIVVRCHERNLLLHSPTPLVPQLKAQIAAIGQPRWIIGPNQLHYWWIPEWQTAFPDAVVWLAPRMEQQAGGCIDFRYRLWTGRTAIHGTPTSTRFQCPATT